MRIEYHNAHGSQLVLTLSKNEAVEMINGLSTALLKTNLTDVSHYAGFKIEFENDNNRWVPTDLDVLVEGDRITTENIGCKPAFPCGKPVVGHPYCPDGPCNLTSTHDGPCYIRQ
jgi:hypothetical protein